VRIRHCLRPQAVRDPSDTAVGRRPGQGGDPPRRRPALLYIYQGDELGLDEVDVPRDEIQDPMHARSGGIDPGGTAAGAAALEWRRPAVRFSPDGASDVPWLTQPAHWARLTVEAQAADPESMLALYRSALRIRRAEGALNDGAFEWLPSDRNVLAFGRGHDVISITNLSGAAIALPPHRGVLLASADILDGHLPNDATVWLRPARESSSDENGRVPNES
jgi:alpha-glucosidase